jgi:hypothetical protein
MAERQSSLPPASILQKLKEFNPEAPDWILSRSEELQRLDHAKPLAKSPVTWRAFVQGVRDVFSFSARPLHRPALARLSLQDNWDTVGDYLRMAMRDYMEQSGLTADMLGLSGEEKKALSLVFLKDDNYPPLSP